MAQARRHSVPIDSRDEGCQMRVYDVAGNICLSGVVDIARQVMRYHVTQATRVGHAWR
jgi:hypothetical protein